jgi:hypothetical protein
MTACIVFGPAWGWLLGLFVLAHLRVYGDPVRAAEFSVPVADHLRTYGLGTPVRSLTETLPSLREGASLKPWTVAELLRLGQPRSLRLLRSGEHPPQGADAHEPNHRCGATARKPTTCEDKS